MVMNEIVKELGFKLSNSDIDLFESKFCIKLPETIVDFYLKWNGGELKNKFKYIDPDSSSGVYPIFTIMPLKNPIDPDSDSVSSNMRLFRSIDESYMDYIPITFDLFDNYIAASLKDGKIYWMDHEEPDNLILFADNIFSFIDSLVKESPEELDQ